MNIEKYEEAWALAPTVPQTISATDKTPAGVIQYVPTLGSGGSSASIELVQNSSMTFLVDSSTPSGADAIGASGIIDTSSSTYGNLGKLFDYINGRRAFRAYLVAGLRADASSILKAKSATACHGANGLTFEIDTSQNEGAVISGTAGAYEITGLAVSGEKFLNNGKGGHVKDALDECENAILYAEIHLAFTGTGVIQIWSGEQGSDETLLYNQTLTTATEQDYGRSGTAQADGLNSIFVKANRGERLIIRAGTTSAFSAWTKFNLLGKTAVLNNSRMVNESSYPAIA